MKKLLTLALAVLGFTVAQAVNITWAFNATNYSNTAFTDAKFATYAGNSLSTYAAFTLPTTLTASTLFVIANNNATLNTYNNAIEVGFTSEGKLCFSVYKTNTGVESPADVIISDTKLEAGSSHKIAFAFKRGSDNSAITDFYFWVDGKQTLDYDLAGNSWNGPQNRLYVPTQLDEISIYSGLFTDEQGKNLTVPEPTVLALLALGVAGVALRRKKVVA